MVCPNCQTNNKDDVKFCINCGTQIASEISKYPPTDRDREKSVTLLILALINMTVVLPFVATFAGLWFIFGGLSGSAQTYYGLLIPCVVYIIFSFGFLIISITRMIGSAAKNNSVVSSIVKAIVIVVFTLTVIAIIAAIVKFL